MQKEENFHKIKDSPFDTEWSENVPNTPVLDEGDSISLSPLKNTNILKSLQNLSINEYSPKHSGIYDPSMDLSGINNVSVLDPDLKSDDGNKSVYKDDMVYLSNLYKKIQNNDMKSARVQIESLIDKKELDKINKKEICLFIKETFPNMYKQITEDINSLNIVNQDIVKDTEKLTNIIKSKSFEISSAKNIIKNQIKDFINKYNTMISDYKIKYNDEENFGTFFNNLFDSLNRFNQEYQNFKSEYKSIKESSDVSELKKLLEEKKMAIKQLQNENVSFSEAITKLDTNNIKLKKECVILSSEYKKLVESVKLKNKIIEKQKKILEVLQKQKESSEENKTKLVNELNDCKKRIDDFESLRNSPR
ncbi:hypothetical protein P3W45_000079 [Vairimorpha bombi]